MNSKLDEIKQYFSDVFLKNIHSAYVKKDMFLGDVYFINDAYVLKQYDDVPIISLERLNSVHELLANNKIAETVIGLDTFKNIKVTKIMHGDLSYEDEPSVPQLRGVAKVLRKLHKNVSENDIPMDMVTDFYSYKEKSQNHLNKVYENKIVREFNNIKDKTPIGLCHNYLTKDNVIYRHDSTFLINFELANINYTYFDLASFIYENKLSEEAIDTFLSTYFGASYNQLKKKRIQTFIEFYKGYMYYLYQYLYSITNLEKSQKLAEKVY